MKGLLVHNDIDVFGRIVFHQGFGRPIRPQYNSSIIMPAGISHPELGAVAFGVTKLVGYCFAASWASKVYKKIPSEWFLIGLTRTIIGIAFGYPYVHVVTPALGSPLFLLGLIPLRMIEWRLLIKFFYDQRLKDRPLAFKVCVAGMIWSFILDLPAITGWFVIGGFWIC